MRQVRGQVDTESFQLAAAGTLNDMSEVTPAELDPRPHPTPDHGDAGDDGERMLENLLVPAT
jgi:hypothetical protein